MPSGAGPAVAAALGAVLVTATLARPVLRWLPEPTDGDGKVAYRALGTTRFVAGCAVLAGLAVVLAAVTLPAPVLPLWWVLGVPVLLLAAVDARTTWLPLRLTRVAWALMALAAVGSALLGGAGLLGRATLGAAAAGGLYLLLWRLSRGGIGFGDVRLAPLIGAATAAVGWPMLLAALLLGSLAGAAYGVVRLLAGRRGHFAYAPTMLLGAYLACALRALTG